MLPVRYCKEKEANYIGKGDANCHVCKVCFESPTTTKLLHCRHFSCQPTPDTQMAQSLHGMPTTFHQMFISVKEHSPVLRFCHQMLYRFTIQLTIPTLENPNHIESCNISHLNLRDLRS